MHLYAFFQVHHCTFSKDQKVARPCFVHWVSTFLNPLFGRERFNRVGPLEVFNHPARGEKIDCTFATWVLYILKNAGEKKRGFLMDFDPLAWREKFWGFGRMCAFSNEVMGQKTEGLVTRIQIFQPFFLVIIIQKYIDGRQWHEFGWINCELLFEMFCHFFVLTSPRCRRCERTLR